MTDALLHLEIRLHPTIKAFAITDKGSKTSCHFPNHLFYIIIFLIHKKIEDSFIFELSLVKLGVAKSYSKNAFPGGAMTCNSDNNRETSILFVPNLLHYRCLQSHATSGNYFPSV